MTDAGTGAGLILAGDIGGTKTALALFSRETGPRNPLAEAVYPSGAYTSLGAILSTFLDGIDVKKIEQGSFGVAGPVEEGRATITNLAWEVNVKQLGEALGGASICLLNDLEAMASAIPYLEPDDLDTLSAGEPEPDGAIAVLAPGTGLGEAYLTKAGGRYTAHPSEGGHADFAPTTRLQCDLLEYLQGQYTHVSYEWVCSGVGLPNIYRFLRNTGHAEEPERMAKALAGAADPTPIIIGDAMSDDPCELSAMTLDIFINVLGAEAGNMVLRLMATGGVYLGGGIPPRILPALEDGRFLRAFRNKGRRSDVLTGVPVHILINPKTGLLGAAYHALEE
jgi:glucokinase